MFLNCPSNAGRAGEAPHVADPGAAKVPNFRRLGAVGSGAVRVGHEQHPRVLQGLRRRLAHVGNHAQQRRGADSMPSIK